MASPSRCGHCKAMAGAYVKLAETVDPAVASVAEVDCSVEDALCDQQQVGGAKGQIWSEE